MIQGSAWEVGQDDKNRSVMLYWQRTGDPELYLYEMIQLSDDGQSFTAVSVSDQFNADGTPGVSGRRATEVGQRIEVEVIPELP